MSAPLITTKLHMPPLRAGLVRRPALVERLQEGIARRLSLISASAGSGKSTLAGEWLAGCGRPAAWLSLDEGDNDPARFLAYLAAALQVVAPEVGAGALAALQSPQAPPVEALLAGLLNEIAGLPQALVLALDDYHVIEARQVEQALALLVERQPPNLHLVILTRQDPQLPLARLRASGQLSELRLADLRFTPAEAAEFLNSCMGLQLSPDEIAVLETRTEGWVAGLQLAALALQGAALPQDRTIPQSAAQPTDDAARQDTARQDTARQDTARRQYTAEFINAFTGSHAFVLDYLLEEVMQQQPEHVQRFLLRTSILERICGPLCEAILESAPGSGQAALEQLVRANLFIIPLDHERRWYRYHHLFGDLLRKRLSQQIAPPSDQLNELHQRASDWYEANRLPFEAFQHAAAANDYGRIERLIESRQFPLHTRSVATAILEWLGRLPAAVLDERPWLWVRFATTSLVAGIAGGVEQKLQAAERALQKGGWLDDETDLRTRDLLGQIAAARATLAVARYQPQEVLPQAQRALDYLAQDNLPFRFTAYWTLAVAAQYLGDRPAARQAYSQALEISRLEGDPFSTILAACGLGDMQAYDNQLKAAAETYRSILPLFGEHPQPNTGDAALSLARILYEWNDLQEAERLAQQSAALLRMYEPGIDRYIRADLFLARIKLALGPAPAGDLAGAGNLLAQAEQDIRQNNFQFRLPDLAGAQALLLLRQGRPEQAAQLAKAHNLPALQGRALLALDQPAAALALLEPLRRQMQAQGWEDERLKLLALEALALQAAGQEPRAIAALFEALALAQPGGFVRLFLDEGPPMQALLHKAAALPGKTAVQTLQESYLTALLQAFEALRPPAGAAPAQPGLPGGELLSQRELEILRLIDEGLSNQEIAGRLFLALDTVKGYNRRIFSKLQVERRTEAVARARQLGLL